MAKEGIVDFFLGGNGRQSMFLGVDVHDFNLVVLVEQAQVLEAAAGPALADCAEVEREVGTSVLQLRVEHHDLPIRTNRYQVISSPSIRAQDLPFAPLLQRFLVFGLALHHPLPAFVDLEGFLRCESLLLAFSETDQPDLSISVNEEVTTAEEGNNGVVARVSKSHSRLHERIRVGNTHLIRILPEQELLTFVDER